MSTNQKQKIQDLEKQNKALREKLEHASEWMQKVVEEEKENLGDEVDEVNISDIKKNIIRFLGDYPLGALEDEVIDNLLSSEIFFAHMTQDTSLDGTGVIIGYNKAVDILIENYISEPFRSFATKHSKNMLNSSNHIEKNLYQVVYKGYMLSIGRLFEVLECIHNNYQKDFFIDLFIEFLDAYPYIKETLNNEIFYTQLLSLIADDIFGSKRHIGNIGYPEVKKVRNILMGDFQKSNCLFLQIVRIGQSY